MAASCMGNFGTYQYMYRRPAGCNEETVWVTKRYIPNDLRVRAPVPRHKLMAPEVSSLPSPPDHWLPPRPHGSSGSSILGRDHEEKQMYVSQPSTRCEQWSTLRQMLPSGGWISRQRPPNWGTGHPAPPYNTAGMQRRFPHINSPMTRYVDDMHLTNRLFKLH